MAQISISALRDLRACLGENHDIDRFIDVAEWGAQLAADPIIAPMPFHPDPDDFPDVDPDFENDFVLVDPDTMAEDLHRALAPIGRAGQAFAPAKRFHGTDDDFERETDGSVDVGEPIAKPEPVEPVATASEPAPAAAPEPKPTAPAHITVASTEWTEEEDRKILTGLFRDNLTQLACAKLVNRSDNATKFRLRVLQGQIDKRQAPPYAAKIIAELTGGAEPAPQPVPEPAPAIKPEPKPAAAAPAIPKVSPAETASWTALTIAQRALVKHLERMDDSFAPQDDMDIATALFDGRKAPTIAADLGVTPEEVVARFKLMKHRDILDPKGHLSIDGQRDLIVALKYRVAAEAEALAKVAK